MPGLNFDSLPVPAAALDQGLVVTAYRVGSSNAGARPTLREGRTLTEGLSAAQSSALSAAAMVARHLGGFRGAVSLPAPGGGIADWDCLWFPAENGSIAMFLGRAGTDQSGGRGAPADHAFHETWRQTLLDAFAAACVHETAQPLAAAQAAAAALALAELPGPAREALGQVQAAVARLAELLRTLRRQAAAPAAAVAPLDAVAEVQRALRQLDSPAAVRLLPSAGLPKALAAPHAVELVALNLIRNALAAASRTGKPEVRVGLAAADGFLELEVSDNGPGVPADEVPALFAPLGERQNDRLGLLVARRLAELHGGELRLRRNEPGRGSAFVATLPLAPESRSGEVP